MNKIKSREKHNKNTIVIEEQTINFDTILSL